MTQGYRPPRDVSERFWEKVNRTKTCWLWTGSRGPKGYGTFSIGSRTDRTRGTIAAHRMAWTLERGEIPKGYMLHHDCENPSCVRPSHLRLLTPREHVYKHDGPTAQNGRLKECRKCGRKLRGRNLLVEGRARARRCRHCRNEYSRELKRKLRMEGRLK